MEIKERLNVQQLKTVGNEGTTLELWADNEKGYYIGVRDFNGNITRVTMEKNKVLDLIAKIFVGK